MLVISVMSMREAGMAEYSGPAPAGGRMRREVIALGAVARRAETAECDSRGPVAEPP